MNGNELIDMHDLWPGINGVSPGPSQVFCVKLALQSNMKVCKFPSFGNLSRTFH